MSMDILSSGTGEFRFTDPDVIRAWMRDHKRRDFVDKTSSETDAVGRFVKDGAYISFDSGDDNDRLGNGKCADAALLCPGAATRPHVR